MVPVVALRQPPQVVITVEGTGRVARADAHLQVQHLVPLVPHLGQPVEAVPRLAQQRPRRRAAELARGREQQDVCVRGRVGELQVVAGVEPATGDIHRAADPMQPAVGDHVRSSLEVRPCVDVCMTVEKVGRPAMQPGAHHRSTVTLHLVEPRAVTKNTRPHACGGGHPEPGRPDLRAREREPVPAGVPYSIEVQAVDVAVVAAPRPAAMHGRREDAVPGRVQDEHARVVQRRRRHQHREFRLETQVAGLVDPQLGLRRGRGGRCLLYGQRSQQQRDRSGNHTDPSAHRITSQRDGLPPQSRTD